MKRLLVFLIFGLSFAKETPLFVVLTKADTNFIILTKTPLFGAEVYRKGKGGEFKKLTQTPLKPASTPEEVRAILGDDFDYIAEIVGATDEMRLLYRLKYSSFRGTIMSFLNLKVAKLLGRLFLDYPIKQGETYTYRVVFLRVRGEGPSETRKFRAREIIPKPPEKISVEPGDRKVEIRWKYREWKGDLNDLVIAFNIYRREKGSKELTKINPVPILRQNQGKFSFTDYSVENGRSYEYLITAVDVIGRESRTSAPVSAVPIDRTPPVPPTGLVAMDHRGRAVLRWNMSLDLDVAYYNVYRNTYIGEKYRKVNKNPIPFDSTVFVDSTVLPGKRYFYAVSAVDSAGNEGKKCNPVIVHIRDTFPPAPPTNMKAVYRNGVIKVTWSPSKSKDILGYFVHRGTVRKLVPKINIYPLPPTTTTYVDSGYGGKGFAPGRTYYVGVTALDSSGNESELHLVKVTVPDSEPPEPPLAVSLFNLRDGKVRISFTPSPSLDKKYYIVYRIIGKKKEMIARLNKDTHTYIDSTATPGLKIHYEITTVDTAGNEGKPVVSKVIVVREKVPPDPPGSPEAIVTEKGVRITWKKSHAADVVGYYVYRSRYPNGRFERLNSKPIKKLSFLDRKGKKYHFYRVSAVDESGNEGISRTFRPGIVKK